MWHYVNVASGWVSRISSEQWFYILIAVTVAGAMCMRGFGSRKNY